ncbi:MAG: helix-turn-helix transcriptional regulator [Candidatus Rokubacteria bacterium]|nr:helix-turn-helix transcriptional regulator [Candidatus Rokubacteria bacterium]
MTTLGERIRQLREARDLSLREFAKKLGGLSAAFLSDVELGRRHPSDAVLADMARVLGTTVEDLKQYDSRTPVEELKRLSNVDPAFGFAFRKLVDKDVNPQELMKFLEKQPDRRKKKQ